MTQTNSIPKINGAKRTQENKIECAKSPAIETQKSLIRLEQAVCDNPTAHNCVSCKSCQCSLLADDVNQMAVIGSTDKCQPQANEECEKQDVGKEHVPLKNKLTNKLHSCRQFQPVKLNEVTVNREQAYLPMMPGHIYLSASNLVTWQEIAAANIAGTMVSNSKKGVKVFSASALEPDVHIPLISTIEAVELNKTCCYRSAKYVL